MGRSMADYRSWAELLDEKLTNPTARNAFDEARRDMALGELVRALRKGKGLTQSQLAERMGTKQSVIARLEAGARTPSLDTLQSLTGALGEGLIIGFEDDTGLVQGVTLSSDQSKPDERIQAINYISNNRLLGLVTGDISNPFYSDVAAGVEEVARANGYLLIVTSSDDNSTNEQNLLRSLCQRRVDGLLVIPAPGTDHQFLRSEFHMGERVVFIDRPPRNLEADFVSSDNVGGAREAVKHLLEQGHRRIGALIEDVAVATAQERLQGYKEALKAYGIAYDGALVKLGLRDAPTAEWVTQQQLFTLSSPPTAIFAGNNRTAIGALRAIRARQPTSALVGFDDFELADMLSLTVEAQDPRKLGSDATKILLERLSGKKPSIQHVRGPTWLIKRGSGEIPPKAVTDIPAQHVTQAPSEGGHE
jgi:LacI family transcriptional regulator